MINYLTTFFDEKQLPLTQWILQDDDGETHHISNEVVIESIGLADKDEQKQIARIIRKIDFKNGDVNHFLKHLARALINANNDCIV